jgi:hypothetical protein
MSELNREKALNNEELAMADAIAEYLEQMNTGTLPDAKSFAARYTNLNQTDLVASLNLLGLPRQTIKPDVNGAWLKFSSKNFNPAYQPLSLGSYIQQALNSGDKELAKLPHASLEALKQDQTPISALKDYELRDYAALAKRYGVKDSLFPRMLKWLKGVAKTVSTGTQISLTPRAQFGFARQTERDIQLNEAEIDEAVAGTDVKEAKKDQEEK